MKHIIILGDGMADQEGMNLEGEVEGIKNMLVKICEEFSRIDFFSKKECTGRTRLMRREI